MHSVHLLLICVYGDGRYERKTSKSIIVASINFIYSNKRFYGQLMWLRKHHICLCCLDFSVYLIISMNQIMSSCLSVSNVLEFLKFFYLLLTALFFGTLLTYILLKKNVKFQLIWFIFQLWSFFGSLHSAWSLFLNCS